MSARGKLLAYLLRHAPPSELAIDERGWADIGALLAALARSGSPTTERELRALIRDDAQGRFELDGARIRARQGHSRPVTLDLVAAVPPAQLFHGTALRSLPSIRREGLRRGQRHHVHLSATHEDAQRVAARRKEPVVLVIAAGALHAKGHAFFRSANGVWLTASVPPDAITVPGDAQR